MGLAGERGYPGERGDDGNVGYPGKLLLNSKCVQVKVFC